MFPLNMCMKNLRNQNKYLVRFANTERHRKSAIIYMQNLLNENDKMKTRLIRFKGH